MQSEILNMSPIRMVDLVSQYRDIEKEVDQAIKEVIESAAFINGPDVSDFANALKTYIGTKNVITCANGTDALQIAMMGLGFEPGDEIIVPAFTYVATVEVIALLKLIPVFVDVDPHTFNIDPQKVEDAITSRTRGIVVVHLFGQCAEMESLMGIARKHKIRVIEDNAQSLGAEYTFSDGSSVKSGAMGDVGTTSFFPSKNLGCYGDGGAMFTNNEELAVRLKMISNHGQKRKYFHDIVGVNSRLDTLQAAVLKVKLKHLDEYCAKRQEVATTYDHAFRNSSLIRIPERTQNSSHVFHQYTIKIANGRDELKQFLSEKNIPSMIYYPLPQHLQGAYTGYGYTAGSFPVSEELCDQVLSIPVHTHMMQDQLDYICESVIEWEKKQ